MLFSTRTSLRFPLLEQELLILLEQVSSNSFFTGVRVAQSLVFCAISTIVCHFILFLLAIILCVLGIIPSLQTFLSNLIIQKRRRDLTIGATNFDWMVLQKIFNFLPIWRNADHLDFGRGSFREYHNRLLRPKTGKIHLILRLW